MRNRNIFIAIPIVLSILAVATVGVSLKVKKMALQSQFDIQAANVSLPKDDKSMSDADKIMAKQLIDGLAKVHGVPLKVTLDPKDSTILLSGTTSTDQPGLDAKTAVLSKFEGIMGFLQSLSSLPYQAEYRSLCIGSECSSGLDIAITFKK